MSEKLYQALTLLNLIHQNVLEQDILDIKGIKLPNFFMLDGALQEEFSNQFLELYGPFILNPNGRILYEIFGKEIKKGDIVFDCGANMGLFASYAASKGAEVHCFEPSKNARRLLKKTQRLYPTKIHIYDYAISNECNEELFYETENIGVNYLIDSNMIEKLPPINSYLIKTITLDEFVKENGIYPSFIKIDIEGSDIKALEGAKEIIHKIRPNIGVAYYHNIDDINIIKKFFKNIDYEIEKYCGIIKAWSK